VFLKECHDGPLTSHGGAKRTTTFLKKSYYWPNLKDDAEKCEDLLNLPTKSNTQLKTSRIVTTITDS